MSQITTIVITSIIFLSNIPVRSQNRQWQPIGPWGGRVDEIAIAASEPNILYALQTSTILKSTDFAETWQEVYSFDGISAPVIDGPTRLIVHPQFSNKIYLSAKSALWHSVNGGFGWEAVIDTLGFDFHEITFHPENSQRIYATSLDQNNEDAVAGGGIFNSIDGGQTWQLHSNFFAGNSVIDFVISPLDTAIIYALTYEIYPSTKLFRSKDAGQSWREIHVDVNESIIKIAIGLNNPETIYAICFDVYSNRYGVIKTIDEGQNWARVDTNLPPARIRSFVVDPKNTDLVYAAIGGHYIDTSLMRREAYGLYQTFNGGQNWSRTAVFLSDSLFHDVEIDPKQSKTLYLSAEVLGVYGSQDNGNSWRPRNTNMHRLVGPFAVHPQNETMLYMITNSGILRTVDAGRSWQLVFRFDDSRNNLTITVAPSEPNIIYASSTNQERSIMKSHGGGETWSVWPDSILPNLLTTFVAHPTFSSILYAFSPLGIFKSGDDGRSWQTQNDGLSTLNVNDLVFNPLNANSLYAATSKGLFKSSDRGNHWKRLGLDSTALAIAAVSELDSTIIYSSTPSFLSDFGRLRYSKDEGVSWKDINSPASVEVSNFTLIPQVADKIWITTIDESDFISEVYLSGDGGLTWEPFNDGLPNEEVKDIFIPASNSQALFAATVSSGLYRIDFSTAVQMRNGHRSPQEIELFQSYPNPFVVTPNQTSTKLSISSTKIPYRLASARHVKLTIHNILGQVIATLVNERQEAGFHQATWDGRDKNDRFLPAGIYFVKMATPDDLKIKKVVLMY